MYQMFDQSGNATGNAVSCYFSHAMTYHNSAIVTVARLGFARTTLSHKADCVT